MVGIGNKCDGGGLPLLVRKIGDLKNQSLSQILMSPANTQFREQLKKKGLFSICDGCCYARLKPVLKKETDIRA